MLRPSFVFCVFLAALTPVRFARADGIPPTDAELAAPLDRATVVRGAVARNPAVRATTLRARAIATEADAVSRLPPPELMGAVWQVPLSRPYALNAQMIMFGLHQSFPAPGALGAREGAKKEEAKVEDAAATDRARQVARDAGHAFVDYAESAEKHRVHEEHVGIARKVHDLSAARWSGGGALTDLTQAEVELARAEADAVTDGSLEESARAKINALLARPPGAPLGAATLGAPGVPAWSTDALVQKAKESRPELRAAISMREAQRLEAKAASREASWPTFTVGALYFVGTEAIPAHGYGFDASMSLPWLWGGAARRRDAAVEQLAAATTSEAGAHIEIDADVVRAESAAKSAAFRLQILYGRALPAAKRSFDAAWSGYESGRTELYTLLATRRAMVDLEQEIVMARASLDHALVDLDAAVGVAVPTVPLGPPQGGDHAH